MRISFIFWLAGRGPGDGWRLWYWPADVSEVRPAGSHSGQLGHQQGIVSPGSPPSYITALGKVGNEETVAMIKAEGKKAYSYTVDMSSK